MVPKKTTAETPGGLGHCGREPGHDFSTRRWPFMEGAANVHVPIFPVVGGKSLAF